MGPHVLLLVGALAMLSIMPMLIHLAVALPRIVVATFGGTVMLIALFWLGWVLVTWSEPRW
jgi:hypothetical protein